MIVIQKINDNLFRIEPSRRIQTKHDKKEWKEKVMSDAGCMKLVIMMEFSLRKNNYSVLWKLRDLVMFWVVSIWWVNSVIVSVNMSRHEPSPHTVTHLTGEYSVSNLCFLFFFLISIKFPSFSLFKCLWRSICIFLKFSSLKSC